MTRAFLPLQHDLYPEQEFIETYIKHPVLLTLISKACHRTETRGGLFHDYTPQTSRSLIEDLKIVCKTVSHGG